MSADSFTLEIIGDMLRAAAAEMFLTYGRSAQSPIIYEVLDMGCGLTSAQGELIAEAEGVPGFVGCLGFAVREVLGKFPPTELQPGDVYVTNDPWGGGGTHLSDVVLVMPLFHAGELLAFAANKAHWTELGGMAPGSWTTDSSEIYQEGLQLPALRLYRAGQPQQDLLDILAANVRLPEMTLGDMHAGVAALRAGERAVAQVCARYGAEAFHEAIALQLERGETVARRRLAALPDGSWRAEAWLDDDGVGDEPQYVCVRVTIEGERFVADYSGCAPQASGPINTTRVGLQVSVREIFKAPARPALPCQRWLLPPRRNHLPVRHALHCATACARLHVLGDRRLRQRANLARALPDLPRAAARGPSFEHLRHHRQRHERRGPAMGAGRAPGGWLGRHALPRRPERPGALRRR